MLEASQELSVQILIRLLCSSSTPTTSSLGFLHVVIVLGLRFARLIPPTATLLWTCCELLKKVLRHASLSAAHAWEHTTNTTHSLTSTHIHLWPSKVHGEHARAHLLHTWATTTCPTKHLVNQIGAARHLSTTLAGRHLLESLCKDLLNVAIAEELFENFLRVDIGKVGATTRVHLGSKRIVMATFTRISKAAVCCTDLLKCILCTRGSILIRVYF